MEGFSHPLLNVRGFASHEPQTASSVQRRNVTSQRVRQEPGAAERAFTGN